MKQPISLTDVKQALRDDRFKNNLPEIFSEDVKKFNNNPGCGCNVSFYKKLLKEAKPQLQAYFPDKDIIDVDEQIKKLSQNNFYVINCSSSELEGKLQALPPGRKQLAIARYEDLVTVVVNELDFV
jgi:hypothetical protein